jgi:hypothetical protein
MQLPHCNPTYRPFKPLAARLRCTTHTHNHVHSHSSAEMLSAHSLKSPPPLGSWSVERTFTTYLVHNHMAAALASWTLLHAGLISDSFTVYLALSDASAGWYGGWHSSFMAPINPSKRLYPGCCAGV